MLAKFIKSLKNTLACKHCPPNFCHVLFKPSQVRGLGAFKIFIYLDELWAFLFIYLSILMISRVVNTHYFLNH